MASASVSSARSLPARCSAATKARRARGRAALAMAATLRLNVKMSIEAAPGPLPADTVGIILVGDDGDEEIITVSLVGTVGECAAGTANCDDDWTNGCETDILTSLDHCGACDAACAVTNGQVACIDGSCQVTCDTGWTGDVCDVDVNECDADPAPCDANATCANTDGSYECTCNDGYVGDGMTCSVVDCPTNVWKKLADLNTTLAVLLEFEG